jgi:hypothetical protein
MRPLVGLASPCGASPTIDISMLGFLYFEEIESTSRWSANCARTQQKMTHYDEKEKTIAIISNQKPYKREQHCSRLSI